MQPPPARYSSRNLTLAYAPDQRIALVHGIWRHQEKFWCIRYDETLRTIHRPGAENLAEVLLNARELEGVALASWERYEPPRGVKLFADDDPRWIRRRHRRVRDRFLELRWPVRPSKRRLAAVKRLSEGTSS